MSQGSEQRPRTGWRLIGLTAGAGACAALGWRLGAIAIPFVSGAALLALLAWPRPSHEHAPETDEVLRAHLARARRRNEPVDVLVAQLLEGSATAARRMRDSLRITDSSYLIWDGDSFELRAMVDRERL